MLYYNQMEINNTDNNKLSSVQKASEEVNRRNAEMTIKHSNDTRKIVRTLEEQVNQLKSLVVQQNTKIQILEDRITTLIKHAFTGGSTI